MKQRAPATGYRTECFFLHSQETYYSRIDRILYSRGIVGVILAAPRLHDAPLLRMTWPRYAFATIDYSWESPAIHRVAPDYRKNVELVFEKLLRKGYLRIGVSIRLGTPNDMDR